MKKFKILTNAGEILEVEGWEYSNPLLPDIKLFLHKNEINDKFYKISEVRTGMFCYEGKEKGKKSCLEGFNENLKANLEANTLDNIIKTIEETKSIKENNQDYKKRQELKVEFKNIFGFEMPFNYLLKTFCKIDMIDIIKFDNIIETPDGISTNDFIKEKYGERAVEVVSGLI